jgi:hypothetical protein
MTDDAALAREAWGIVQRGDTVTDPALAAEVVAAAKTVRLNTQPNRLDRVVVIGNRIILGILDLLAVILLFTEYVRDGLIGLGFGAVFLGLTELRNARIARRLRNAARSEQAARAMLAG